jgi:hypothetical protein
MPPEFDSSLGIPLSFIGNWPEQATQAGQSSSNRGATSLLSSPGNLAWQRVLNFSVASNRTMPTVLEFDPEQPWLFKVNGQASPSAITQQLYGIDLSTQGQPQAEWTLWGWRYAIIPELLRPEYRQQFHKAMNETLERDIARVKSVLLEGRMIQLARSGDLIRYVRWWSERKNLRTASGQSYFDAFLSRLNRDRLYTDYLVYKGESWPYLSELYDAVGQRVGEITALISQNSTEFGSYQPELLGIQETAPRSDTQNVSVQRAANQILDRLEDWTSDVSSRAVADILAGLTPQDQAAVLQNIMGRYGERSRIFGRFGEASEEGMLYYLFWNLQDSDKERLGEALVSQGVLTPEAVGVLSEGRPFLAEMMPYTTHKAHEAATYWANVANNSAGFARGGATVMGGFSTLWTPENVTTTVTTLATPGALKFGSGFLGGLAPRVAPHLMRGAQVLGVGVGAYQGTIELQTAISGHDPYTGQPVSPEAKLSAWLMALSNVLLVGASILDARVPAVQSSSGNQDLLLSSHTTPTDPVLSPAAPALKYQVLGVDAATGEYTVLGTNLETGEHALLRLNPATGNGTITSITTGEMRVIRGGQLEPASRALLPAGEETASTQRALAAEGQVTRSFGQVAQVDSSMDFAAQNSRLQSIIRTGGGFDLNTRGMGAAIVEIPGYNGPHELRAISSLATDLIGEGASVVHATTPQIRSLDVARSIRGSSIRGEWFGSHINDAEVKIFERIRSALPPNPRGRIHILSMRSRLGGSVLEPLPVCSSCEHAMHQFKGDFPGIDIVVHSETFSAPVIDFE